jgi:hypothetical protein
MNTSNNNEFRHFFGLMKKEDAAAAPTFQQTLTRKRLEQETLPLFPWLRSVAGLATAAALIFIVAQFTAQHPEPSADIHYWTAFSEWTASTDQFLISPDFSSETAGPSTINHAN